MPRASTTTDVFNAIAESRRRDIIDVLARDGEMAVGDLVLTLGISQPAVSKHLAVLREVNIVAVTRRGRERLYRLNPEELKPVHAWIQAFERLWANQLMSIKARAEAMAAAQRALTQRSIPATPGGVLDIPPSSSSNQENTQ